jgi:hypothetical protein
MGADAVGVVGSDAALSAVEAGAGLDACEQATASTARPHDATRSARSARERTRPPISIVDASTGGARAMERKRFHVSLATTRATAGARRSVE